jgi:hypothetical protein
MEYTLAVRAAISVFQIRYATVAKLVLVPLDTIPARAPIINTPIQTAHPNVVCPGAPGMGVRSQ